MERRKRQYTLKDRLIRATWLVKSRGSLLLQKVGLKVPYPEYTPAISRAHFTRLFDQQEVKNVQKRKLLAERRTNKGKVLKALHLFKHGIHAIPEKKWTYLLLTKTMGLRENIEKLAKCQTKGDYDNFYQKVIEPAFDDITEMINLLSFRQAMRSVQVTPNEKKELLREFESMRAHRAWNIITNGKGNQASYWRNIFGKLGRRQNRFRIVYEKSLSAGKEFVKSGLIEETKDAMAASAKLWQNNHA